MANWTDRTIRGWIQKGEHFDLRTDSNGLCLSYREAFKWPVWRLRYRIGGKAKVMVLGSYRDLSLADARSLAREMRARVALGYDVGAEKQARKQSAKVQTNPWTVTKLADEYWTRKVSNRIRNADRIKIDIELNILPVIGKKPVDQVRPMDIDAMLTGIVDRGAPTTANYVLRLTKQLFNYAVTRHLIQTNPAAAFKTSDAGGEREKRDRALSREEITRLFEVMRDTVTPRVYHAIRLLLLLAVRKHELTEARLTEFDLAACVWHLPKSRSKTGVSIDVPLSQTALDSINELIRLGCSSRYLVPATASTAANQWMNPGTLNRAILQVRAKMPDMPAFTIHDLRRTARTQLASLGISSHVAERCLNHKLKGVEGTYNTHDYFGERRAALTLWAEVVEACEQGREWTLGTNVSPIRKTPTA